MANLPKTEVWYCWKEFRTVEGEDGPRLLTPRGDPMLYEYPADEIFDTSKEAHEWKAENASEEDWILCRSTVKPIKPAK